MNETQKNQKEARERLAATHGRDDGPQLTTSGSISPNQAHPGPSGKPADGGPAFPQFAAWSTDSGLNCGTMAEGLSARAYCAVHVLAGMLANPEFEPRHTPGETSEQAYARRAVDYADELLARLNSGRGAAGQADAGAVAAAALPPAAEVLQALNRLVDLVERGHRHFAFEAVNECDMCRAGAAALGVLAKAKAQGWEPEEGGAP